MCLFRRTNVSPTTPATRINKPPMTEPATKPGETASLLLFGQSDVVRAPPAPLAPSTAAVGTVEVVVVELEEKNVMDNDITVG